MLDDLVTRYLEEQITAGRNPWPNQGEVKKLLLSRVQREKLREDTLKLSGVPSDVKSHWENYLKGIERYHDVTFYSSSAAQNSKAFFLNPIHPLVRLAAASGITLRNATVHICCASEEHEPGIWPFSLYAWHYTGFRERTRIVTVCESHDLAESFVSMLSAGYNDPSPEKFGEADVLERIHVRMWQEATHEELTNAKATADYRRKTLEGNSLIKQKALRSRLQQFEDKDRLVRMYTSMLREEEENLALRLEKISRMEAKTDIQTTLLAQGTIRIVRP